MLTIDCPHCACEWIGRVQLLARCPRCDRVFDFFHRIVGEPAFSDFQLSPAGAAPAAAADISPAPAAG